ncbi:CcdB family protein [Paraglaciecola aquimarina]|uniref:Toxin CcdB n=1 Tax=Paraglaciecola algarum TaxID=3050085 RepID=A0ABS9DB33_9ALTE|nr:CcdB family protein [Paraglaciecola sp. G1-23]MCF2950165.1 CcdB family protein [Paraglaciecola sp. G1-23]
MIHQFGVYQYSTQPVVVITNTIFNDVESILVAPLKEQRSTYITNIQIAVKLDSKDYLVDLLDLATVTKSRLKPSFEQNLKQYRNEIKSGIDLLIDGF